MALRKGGAQKARASGRRIVDGSWVEIEMTAGPAVRVPFGGFIARIGTVGEKESLQARVYTFGMLPTFDVELRDGAASFTTNWKWSGPEGPMVRATARTSGAGPKGGLGEEESSGPATLKWDLELKLPGGEYGPMISAMLQRK